MIIKLLVLVVLTVINAFFAAAEMAMISCDKIKLKNLAEDGNKNAKLLIEILKEPSKFLSTIQVGITLAGFFSSASAAVSISGVLGDYLVSIGISIGRDISFVIITILLSFIMLVFGELVPKRIALNYSEKFSIFVVRPIRIIQKLMSPFVATLTFSTNIILKIFGVNHENLKERVTLEQISSLIEVGHEQGLINPVERDLIKSAISFDEKNAKEIMTPRTKVFAIDKNKDISFYIDRILDLKYSRFPVYEGNIDKIIGVVYIKDLFRQLYKKGDNDISIASIIKEGYFVPDRKNINDLFNELKEKRQHMAILIDEYGGFSGIVTMEDLIEEIVGEIDDEFDQKEEQIKMIDINTILIPAHSSISQVNKATGLSIDEKSDNYDTIGGFIIYKLGYIPSKNDKVETDIGTFYIIKSSNKRINKLKFIYRDNNEKE